MRPYFASSQARSRYSIDGEIAIRPVCGSPGNLALPAGDARELAQRDVHLDRPRARAEAADVAHDVVRELTLADEVAVGRDRVGVRDDEAAGDHLARLELDAGGPPVADDHSPDRGVGAQLGSGRAGRAGERAADSAHPAVDPAPGAGVAVDLADPVVHQHVRRPRGHRASPGADHRLRAERALDALVLEPLVEQIGCGEREEAEQLGDVAALPVAQLRAEPEPAGEVAQPQVRRDDEEQVSKQPGKPLEVAVELGIRVAVVLRELRDLLPGAGHVAPHRQRRPVRERDVVVRLEDRHAVAVVGQPEVAHDLRRHQADDVRGRRDPVAGPRLLGDRRPAERGPLLEHEHVEPAAREVGGAREPVVAPADDDHVALASHPESMSTA